MGGKVTSQGTSITKLTNDLATTNGKVDTKADATALTALDNKVTSIGDKVTTNSNAITTLSGRVTTTEKGLATKLDASVISGYYTKGQTDTKAAEIAAGKVEEFSVTLRELPSQGENLVPNGTFDPNLPSYGFTGIPSGSEDVPAGCPFPYVTRLAYRDHFLDVNKTTNIPCKAGDVYEVSVLVACATGTANFNLCTYRRNTATTFSNLVASQFGRVTAAEGATWKRLTARWTVPAHATHQFFVPFLQIDQASPFGTVWYATDWSCVNVTAGAKAQAVADASATAVTNTNAEVSRINSVVVAQGSSITNLQSGLATANNNIATKADGSALSALTTRVSNAEGVNTSQGTAITSLENSVNHATTGLASKASSTALATLNNKVTSIDGRVTTNSSNITTLQGKVTVVEKGLATKADGSALTALTTRVSNAEGELSSQSSKVTKLEAGIGNTSTYVVSTSRNGGYREGGLPWGLYNSTLTRLSAFSRGFNLIVWAADGSYSSVQRFDTYGSTANVASLATALLALPVNTYFTLVGTDNIGTTAALQGNADLKNFVIANGGSASYYSTWGGNNLPIFTSMVGTGTGTGIQHSFNSNITNDWIKYPISLISGIPEGFAGVQPIDESKFATASALSTLDSKVTSIDGKITTHASSITQLQADVSGNSSKLIVQGDVVDGLKASYVVKTDVNGLVAGYGLYNTGSFSAFGVNADFFYVGKGTTAANGKKPFMVITAPTTIGGVTYPAGTWIDVAMIANATIGSAHIANASINDAHIVDLNAEKITAGFINADRIGANTISAEKLVIGDTTNLWVNPYFSQSGPRLYSYGGRTQWSGGIAALKSKMGLQLWGRDHIAPYSTRIPLKVGETFVIEYTAGLNAGPYKELGVGLWVYDNNGSEGTRPFQFGSGTIIADLGAGWFRWRRVFQVSDNGSGLPAAFGCLYFQINQAEYDANPSYWTIGDVLVRRQMGGELIVNGAITADKISVNEVSAISANLGTFTSTVPNKGKTVISGNKIEIFDTSNVRRVFIGVE